ncbi:MAG: lipoate--protein ligase [Caldisericia bacterium]|nr:lipoate--protein ligase [Caldisericia bacterium]
MGFVWQMSDFPVFREIDTEVKSAVWNMASDDILLKEQAKTSLPTLRFLSFERCALVGYFQSISQEIRVDYCKQKDIKINRRITGGGSLYFDPSQVGWEIIAPLSLFNASPEQYYEIFGASVAIGLQKLGIQAVFKKRNDIEINGKKVSGMGGITYGNSFLFQGTLLVEDRIEEMLYSLRVPIEKLKPKEINSVRERVTCVQHELGRIPSREELKDAIRFGFNQALGITTKPGQLTKDEEENIEKSLDIFSSQKWIDRIKMPDDTQGLLSGAYRSNIGTIKISMLVNASQKMIRSTHITGDFLLECDTILNDLERLLRNIHFDESKIIEIVEKFFENIPYISSSEFVMAFAEVLKKWDWVKQGFTPSEANSLFAVNFSPGEKIEPRVFLFPYCAKDSNCQFRYRDECTSCSVCETGDGYKMAIDAGLIPVTITSFEDLEEKFVWMKNQGINAYIGSCCEAFYVKHQEEFIGCGLKGLLIDVQDSTCYDLDKAHQAYAGTFENKTSLDMGLIGKVLNIKE